jgi:Scavenger mRNA decapping enzyme C-term binding
MKRHLRLKNKCIVHETEVFFDSVPYKSFIENEINKKQWIYKIINGEKEQDQIIYRDESLMILPDLETRDDASILNWIVIFTEKDLTSLRMLNASHIELLEATEKIVKRLLPTDFQDAMLYFHYPPSVWQLHLHVSAPCNVLRTTNSMQKVYFLRDVISALKLNSEFLKKATLSYVLPHNHELCVLYKEQTAS